MLAIVAFAREDFFDANQACSIHLQLDSLQKGRM
jgi:hypothetical protein